MFEGVSVSRTASTDSLRCGLPDVTGFWTTAGQDDAGRKLI